MRYRKDRPPSRRTVLWIAGGAVLVLLLGIRAFRHRDPSAAEEMEVGERLAEQAGWDKLESDPEVLAYVRSVGGAVAEGRTRKDVEFVFYLIDLPVPNAGALPGGRIAVTTGLLSFAESEAELAAVIGHEVAHVDLRHTVRHWEFEERSRRARENAGGAAVAVFSALVESSYSQANETEADAEGARLAALAGYNPNAARHVFSRMAEAEKRQAAGDPLAGIGRYFSSHPLSFQRMLDLESVAGEILKREPGKRYYQGEKNLRGKVPLSREAYEEEWVVPPPPP